MIFIFSTARIGLNRLRTVAGQMSRAIEHWETVATVPVPEADRTFYRISFQ